MHDKHALPHLLHGAETRVWGDSAYQSQGELIRAQAPKAKDFTHRRTRYKGGVDEVERAKNKTKSRVCAKVEHDFAVIKLQFGFTTVRYRGFKKNVHRLFAHRTQQNCIPKHHSQNIGGLFRGSLIFPKPLPLLAQPPPSRVAGAY